MGDRSSHVELGARKEAAEMEVRWVAGPRGWAWAEACDSGGPGALVEALPKGSVLGSCKLCPRNDI